MMDLESAIQHCKDQVQEQAKKGCYSCAEEHQQLAEWLKELKAYREQSGKRMNVEEKERLIKKDIVSIENRVRHAFNQGYEMGLKENKKQSGDAISRQAVLYLVADYDLSMGQVVKAIHALPSVTPQQKMGQRTGRWKRISIDKYSEHAQYWYRCDKCGKDNLGNTNFCPNCGAKMEVEE